MGSYKTYNEVSYLIRRKDMLQKIKSIKKRFLEQKKIARKIENNKKNYQILVQKIEEIKS